MTARPPELAASSIASLIAHAKVIVCCGAGGVGKTTTAASLSIAAARQGRKVLVLTIDPSKRLAETLGVSRNPPRPVPLPTERLAAAGIAAPGMLETWMLDPKLVSDESVRRLVKDEAEAQKIMQNRIYQHATSMVAGLHEYTAMEALHRFLTEGRYDLVVLDTPPSRNALDFLEAPGRLAKFLDGTIFRMFLPKEGGIITRAASKLIERVLRGVFGQEFASELTAFFAVFSGIFSALNADLTEMRTLLSGPDVAFLLVTSPAPAALKEAHFFQDRIAELGLPFRGFVLNKSRARTEGKVEPDASLLAADAPEAARTGMEKLKVLAKIEKLQAAKDQGLLADLQLRAGPGAIASAVPSLPQGADELGTLLQVAAALLRA